MPSRIDTLQGPRGRGRGPLLVILLVFAAVITMLAIGAWGPGWWVAFLLPAAAFSVVVAIVVLVRLFRPVPE